MTIKSIEIVGGTDNHYWSVGDHYGGLHHTEFDGEEDRSWWEGGREIAEIRGEIHEGFPAHYELRDKEGKVIAEIVGCPVVVTYE